MPGVEIRADKRGNIWSHWYIRYVAPFALLASVWGAFFIYDFFTGDKIAKQPISSTQATTIVQPAIVSPQVNQPTSPALAPVVPLESLTMRIASTIVIDGKTTVYVHNYQKKHLMKVGMEQCKQTVNGIECNLNNEVVTAYTGKQIDDEDEPPTLTSVVPKV